MIIEGLVDTRPKPYKKIGDKIKRERKLKHYTGSEVAEWCDMSWSHFNHIENGYIKPSTRELKKIANVLDVDSAYFLLEG